MNRSFILILILTALFLLIACRRGDGQAASPVAAPGESDTHIFEATVLEIANDMLLVEPAEGAAELRSADRIRVSFRGIEDEESLLFRETVAVGDRILIGYDGMIAETYPAQILNVYSIRPAGD